MANAIEQVLVPDLGGAEDVEVIEILVKPGDKIAKDDSMITLESDKASMDVPAPFDGVVKDVQVKIGDKVQEGTKILTLTVGEAEEKAEKEQPKEAEQAEKKASKSETQKSDSEKTEKKAALSKGGMAEQGVRIPDLGEASDVDVIEIAVKPGDNIAKDDSLITLEGDKASMDVPSPFAGEITKINVKVGDKVSTNDLILSMKTEAGEEKAVAQEAPSKKEAEKETKEETKQEQAPAPEAKKTETQSTEGFGTSVHAGPAVRRIAREFGVNLTKVRGSAAKGRITKEDVQQFVKSQLKIAEQGGGMGGISIAPAPKIDFSKFGAVETKPLSKIKKLTGANLSRNWVTIPHVTQFEEADITEMEAFRKSQKGQAEAQGIRLTPLVFIMKAVVGALKEFPAFNASLDPSGENLILKKYFHIGVAVDTPNGLVVPVIRDVDQKGLFELGKELGEISEKAREKGLGLTDMQGGCFSISSLGGIGGTAFTPIINAPEVAILGVSKMQWKPICDKEGVCKTRLMMPLSLSYDHRVIDGAEAARFIVFLANRLADIRTLLL